MQRTDGERVERIARRAIAPVGQGGRTAVVSSRSKSMGARPLWTGKRDTISMAVAEAVCRWLDMHPTAETLARVVAKRGKRSAVGIHGYFVGGLIFEACSDEDELNPIQARSELPSNWCVAILRPELAAILSTAPTKRSGFRSSRPLGPTLLVNCDVSPVTNCCRRRMPATSIRLRTLSGNTIVSAVNSLRDSRRTLQRSIDCGSDRLVDGSWRRGRRSKQLGPGRVCLVRIGRKGGTDCQTPAARDRDDRADKREERGTKPARVVGNRHAPAPKDRLSDNRRRVCPRLAGCEESAWGQADLQLEPSASCRRVCPRLACCELSAWGQADLQLSRPGPTVGESVPDSQS